MKLRSKIRSIIGVVILAIVALNCSPEKKMRKAFNQGQYQRVINYYSEQLKKDPNNGKANFMVAESFRLSNRIKEAEPYYERSKGRGIDEDSVRFYYSQSLRANGKYDESRAQLEELEASAESEKLKVRAKRVLDGFSKLDDLEQKPNYYKIKNLETINTPFAEFSPVHNNGILYFATSRSNESVYEATGTPYTDIYKAETNGANVNVETIAPLPSVINDEIRNEACATFTPDGRTMVYAKGNTKQRRKGGIDVDLYISRYRNGVWSESTPINLNTQFKDENSVEARRNSWDSTPSFSPDGRTIYFASNRRGGYGGTDLYSAIVDSRGRFGRIRNMGPDINTPGDEMFPYMADNGKFYFASDGHPGYGMLDLFVVNRVNGKTVVENLGKPVNSTADDFGIYLFKADRGFFTSNREGGKGDDDIYTFVNEDPNLRVINYFVQGVVYTYKQDSTLQEVNDTHVTLIDGSGETMQDFTTGNDGKFLFRVYENEDYNLLGEADGYLVKRQPFTMRGKSIDPATLKELVTNITVDTVILLDKLSTTAVFELRNIYFEYNMDNINPASSKELDKLVDILQDNPEIKIELSSHTDSVGTHERNMDLSQRRATSSVNYLIRKGISPERLVAKGYGETRPVARNSNRDGSDNPGGRARNRRTEFRILEIGAVPARRGTDDEDDKFFRNNN
jgi:outer membrane protein OmpA-like peptidoglycan-associated protein